MRFFKITNIYFSRMAVSGEIFARFVHRTQDTHIDTETFEFDRQAAHDITKSSCSGEWTDFWAYE